MRHVEVTAQAFLEGVEHGRAPAAGQHTGVHHHVRERMGSPEVIVHACRSCTSQTPFSSVMWRRPGQDYRHRAERVRGDLEEGSACVHALRLGLAEQDHRRAVPGQRDEPENYHQAGPDGRWRGDPLRGLDEDECGHAEQQQGVRRGGEGFRSRIAEGPAVRGGSAGKVGGQ